MSETCPEGEIDLGRSTLKVAKLMYNERCQVQQCWIKCTNKDDGKALFIILTTDQAQQLADKLQQFCNDCKSNKPTT